jgi:hypothetical protein
VSLRRLLAIAFGLVVVRWAALELASFAGHRLVEPGPPPVESARQPGRMPGPLDT